MRELSWFFFCLFVLNSHPVSERLWGLRFAEICHFWNRKEKVKQRKKKEFEKRRNKFRKTLIIFYSEWCMAGGVLSYSLTCWMNKTCHNKKSPKKMFILIYGGGLIHHIITISERSYLYIAWLNKRKKVWVSCTCLINRRSTPKLCSYPSLIGVQRGLFVRRYIFAQSVLIFHSLSLSLSLCHISTSYSASTQKFQLEK